MVEESADIDGTEAVFVRGAKPRRHRSREDHPFLAIDGTAMTMWEAYNGSNRVAACTGIYRATGGRVEDHTIDVDSDERPDNDYENY